MITLFSSCALKNSVMFYALLNAGAGDEAAGDAVMADADVEAEGAGGKGKRKKGATPAAEEGRKGRGKKAAAAAGVAPEDTVAAVKEEPSDPSGTTAGRYLFRTYSGTYSGI
jgi:hypothetical protein